MEYLQASPYYTYLVLPLLIFIARIFDVSFGTLRIIMVSKGVKRVAPFLGFFEVLIWILAISQIMANLNNWICYIAYAAGFATGNYIGMLIEEKLAMGTLIVRIMIPDSGNLLSKELNAKGFGTTTVCGNGAVGKVDLIYTVVSRKDLECVEDVIKRYDSNAFYSIEDVKKVKNGVFPAQTSTTSNLYKRWRVGL